MNKLLIIGIDGGATKVNAWETVFDEKNKFFSLGQFHSEKKYSEIPGFLETFKPVDVKLQLEQQGDKPIPVTKNEMQQETVYVEACAHVIEKIVNEKGINQVLIGLGMPGLKTADKRGIGVVANGPRMINYSNLLEQRLQSVNIELISPIDHLGSDADYCGIGENFSDIGALKDYDNVYYLGGGTGVADALKIDAELIPLDNTKEWFAKTWEFMSDEGKSLERYCSANGIQSIYAELAAKEVSELNKAGIFPPQIAQLANEGDKHAKHTFDILVNKLSHLLYSRITTLFAGWQNNFNFMNANRPTLNTSHPHLGKYFDKIVVGQRLGDLYNSEDTASLLKLPLLGKLKNLISKSSVLDTAAKDYYTNIEQVITVSKLRDAPALGAGIDAFFSWQD
ncbi:MAG: ROK family protein [Calditrichaeota bacterium]|nr:MAG: ROK family protein [Calditrichota bacterium]MBL1204355.1 ROK family protein [Calditrichota bacterium]NOG44184.1 ROK family protein [Calditrichota bacterium]